MTTHKLSDIPNKLDVGYTHGDSVLIDKAIVRLQQSHNQTIDYLSDKEASKGECKRCMYKLSGGTWRCERCGTSFDEKHPPQQEESRGECEHCHMSLSIRNPSGYCDHLQYPSYCDHCNITADIFSKPQLKEESHKEDEKEWTHDFYDTVSKLSILTSDKRIIERYIKANFVSKQDYYELIMAVGNKYPGETRHQTALRYIRQAERQDCGTAKESA